MVIAPHQTAAFSSKTRTATQQDGQYIFMSQPGAYRFATFTIKDHARVTFSGSDKYLQLGTLELQYGAVLYGQKLMVESNDVIVRPGATLDLAGRGHPATEGPGAGSTTVSLLISLFLFRNKLRQAESILKNLALHFECDIYDETPVSRSHLTPVK